MVKKAMIISYNAHNGTFDKSGMPYVFHPAHVAESMTDEDSICAAFMHDIVEDTDYTLEDIKKEGFNDNVVNAIDAITRRAGEDYFDYIRRVKLNPIAKKIKLADIEHNSNESRMRMLDESTANSLKQKYEKAKEILEND